VRKAKDGKVVRSRVKSGRVISARELGEARVFPGYVRTGEAEKAPVFRELRFVRHVVVNPEERRAECCGSGKDGPDCVAKEIKPKTPTSMPVEGMSLREYYARRRVAALPEVSGKDAFMR